MLRTVILFGLLALTWSNPTLACGHFSDEARYVIEHTTFGTIGEEHLSVRCEDDRVIVERKVDVRVRVLMATLYRRQAHYIEVWQDDQLVHFDGHTNDDGKEKSLQAALTSADVISIDVPPTSIEVPSSAIPTDPWHHDLIRHQILFDRHDGHLMNVDIVEAGDEELMIGGHAVGTRKVIVSGDRQQEIWFDRSTGIWLKSIINHNSGDIIITRESPSPTYWAATTRG